MGISNLSYVECTQNAAHNTAIYPDCICFAYRRPRHPSLTALAGFGLPLHNLASASTVIMCFGLFFYPSPGERASAVFPLGPGHQPSATVSPGQMW